MEQSSPLSSYFLQNALNKRDTAAANYAKDPFDTDNLTKWGRALLQLSRYQNGQDSKKMIEDAILKLQEALVIDPLKHDTLFLLGKCFTALKANDPTEAKGYLHKALACFQKASQEDPANLVYLSSVQQVAKELEMNKDIQSTVWMDKGILTFSLDGLFKGAASSEAKADMHIHSNAETDMDIHTNAEMDEDIHTNTEMDKEDIHTNADMDKDIHTNAFDKQFIDAASCKVKSSKESGVLKK